MLDAMTSTVADPAPLVVGDGEVTLVLHRVEDPFTVPQDQDLCAVACEAWVLGEWGYVGVRARLSVGGRVVGEEVLYGVAETPERPCAFDDAVAVGWVCEQVCRQACAAGVTLAGL